MFEAFTVTALVTSFHNPPLERNPYFTGRATQLSQLHTLLRAGKQVALEYAYRYQKRYHAIFWVTADTFDTLLASYLRLAAILGLSEYDEQDQSKVKAAVERWFSRHTGWLLIIDTIEDLSLLHQFVPVDRHGAVLLTTRRHVTERVAQALELELLPENDAILFLLKRIKVLAFDRSLADASDQDIEAARSVARILGHPTRIYSQPTVEQLSARMEQVRQMPMGRNPLTGMHAERGRFGLIFALQRLRAYPKTERRSH